MQKMSGESVAFCGLICHLCFLAGQCDGCRTVDNLCERNQSDQGCENRICCQDKGYQGCWQCSDLMTCTKGIYQIGNSEKVKAFAICIQQDGKELFIEYVLRNVKAGINAEKGGDYDHHSLSRILEMLRIGK